MGVCYGCEGVDGRVLWMRVWMGLCYGCEGVLCSVTL